MIVFFIRQFNDLDHITPIVYKFLQRTQDEIIILSQNPELNIGSDFRLSFLKKNFKQLKIDYVYRIGTSTFIHKLIAGLICEHPSLLAKPLQSFLLDKFFDKNWAVKLLKHLKAGLVVFDHAEAEILVYKPLVDASKELGIPTVGVPTGLPLFSDGYIEIPRIYQRELKANLDYIIEPHDRIAQFRIRHGFNPNKVKVIGSARFNQEWIDILKGIMPDDVVHPRPSNKLKVVYFERGLDLHGAKKDTVRNTLINLGKLDFIDFVIKPHTRANKLHFKDFPESICLAQEANSVNLIRWADVIIGSVSSILVEAIIQRKILLYPGYFQDDLMLFEEKGACLLVKSYEELEAALKQISLNPKKLPYNESNISEFLKVAVYGGVSQKDVLGEYVQFLQSLIHQN